MKLGDLVMVTREDRYGYGLVGVYVSPYYTNLARVHFRNHEHSGLYSISALRVVNCKWLEYKYRKEINYVKENDRAFKELIDEFKKQGV